MTRNLLTSGRAAGVRHFVALSIVGIDRVDYGYYRGKRVQEQLLLAEDRPSSVLRATQFLEFAAQLLDRMRGPVVFVPRMRMQPVAAREVGEKLAEIAVGEPMGRAPDLAGPREELLIDMVRQVLKARSQRRLVVPMRLPGSVGRQLAGGGLLPKATVRGVSKRSPSTWRDCERAERLAWLGRFPRRTRPRSPPCQLCDHARRPTGATWPERERCGAPPA